MCIGIGKGQVLEVLRDLLQLVPVRSPRDIWQQERVSLLSGYEECQGQTQMPLNEPHRTVQIAEYELNKSI